MAQDYGLTVASRVVSKARLSQRDCIFIHEHFSTFYEDIWHKFKDEQDSAIVIAAFDLQFIIIITNNIEFLGFHNCYTLEMETIVSELKSRFFFKGTNFSAPWSRLS